MTRFSWAAVTQESPLRVRVDGETDPLPVTPSTLVAGLIVGDRVWCQLEAGQVVVVGKNQ